MNKTFAMFISFVLTFLFIIPTSDANAAGSSAVTTKIYSYKGQKYVQIIGGEQKVRDKINKTLKIHAVNAAIQNTYLKKQQDYFYWNTTAQTKYNQTNLLSIVYTDYNFRGGAHGYEEVTTYNFDLTTGTRLYLDQVVPTNKQAVNLAEGIESDLKRNESVFPESFYNFPLYNTSSFYYQNTGIVIVFNPYEVGPYAAGFIEVKVPFSKIQSEPSRPYFDLNQNSIQELKSGRVPGFENIRFGQTKAEVSKALNSSESEPYNEPEMGGLFWIFEGVEHASFNFGEGDTDHLRHIDLSWKTLPMKTFRDIEKILGKGQKGENSNVQAEYLLSYRFGDTRVHFASDSMEGPIRGITISQY
ncbi:DUF3298 and DUF4163 domain-containing protein [Paenibacillus pabuli]|uniref:DUF3298 and DUF4163 domain-containing protein n=1 Tax=Paenibacillus pabuli TaxID=1472 RepID=UPI000782CB9E|nr:DUF3298 and DUF4163 domain-containing protein [Paenibacillus pabuli]MEC0124424.1 DUF3298 domain-containing protein [Paenibacillus pabuli]